MVMCCFSGICNQGDNAMIDDPKGVFPAPFVSGVDENNCIDKDTLTENIVVMVRLVIRRLEKVI